MCLYSALDLACGLPLPSHPICVRACTRMCKCVCPFAQSRDYGMHWGMRNVCVHLSRVFTGHEHIRWWQREPCADTRRGQRRLKREMMMADGGTKLMRRLIRERWILSNNMIWPSTCPHTCQREKKKSTGDICTLLQMETESSLPTLELSSMENGKTWQEEERVEST